MIGCNAQLFALAIITDLRYAEDESTCEMETMMKELSIKNPFADDSAVTEVTSALSLQDILGAIKTRFGFKRMQYMVKPGLYSIGGPDASSPVLVTANYKLTFDTVRKSLEGISAWILVLDTKGVNVWCAAGKGTFGTNELLKRIDRTRLKSKVDHKTLILPQLGATGVSAHEVAKRSGYKVVYGPVRASDIKTFLENGMKATPEMRRVRFTLWDRLVLTPIEVIPALKRVVVLFGIFFILNGLGLGQFGGEELMAFIGAIFAGAFLTPVLLPFIPGRAFSVKGMLMGLVWTAVVIAGMDFGMNVRAQIFKAISYVTLLPVISTYLGLNFTGASTYTSFSGVNKEMRAVFPVLLVMTAVGVIAMVVAMALLKFGLG